MNKVKPGDPLVIPAPTFNTFVDAANDFLARRHDRFQGSRPAARHSGIVLVRNDSGADRARFDLLGIEGPVIAPAYNLEALVNWRALTGITPTAADHTGKFVVLLEPPGVNSPERHEPTAAGTKRRRRPERQLPCPTGNARAPSAATALARRGPRSRSPLPRRRYLLRAVRSRHSGKRAPPAAGMFFEMAPRLSP
jgi:hypothetical protein